MAKRKKASKADKPAEESALTDFEYLQLIMAVVEKAYGIKDVTVRARSRRVSEARQVAMYLARELTPASYPMIGDVFDRDHTTVLHAYRRVSQRLEISPRFGAVVGRLKLTVQRDSLVEQE